MFLVCLKYAYFWSVRYHVWDRLLPIHLGELTLLTVYCSVEKLRRKYISEWFLKKEEKKIRFITR